MLENSIKQVRRPKGVSSERKAFVSRAAQARAAACLLKRLKNDFFISVRSYGVIIFTHPPCYRM